MGAFETMFYFSISINQKKEKSFFAKPHDWCVSGLKEIDKQTVTLLLRIARHHKPTTYSLFLFDFMISCLLQELHIINR